MVWRAIRLKYAGDSRSDSQDPTNFPRRRVVLNGQPLLTRFVSKNELAAIAKAGTYVVTPKLEGEVIPESHRAHLVVRFNEW